MRRYLGMLFMGATLLVPAAVLADEHHDRDKDHRYYDADSKDYHEWNEQEQRAYRHYLEERREHYRPWNKMTAEQQREYWRWRHEHPDWEHEHDRR